MAVSARSSVARCLSNNGCATVGVSLLRVKTLSRRCAACRGARKRSSDARAGLVEVDDDAVARRIALAREPEAARDFVVLEREVDVHVDLALDEAAAAGRAHAALARIRQIDAVGEAAVDDVLLAFLQDERASRAIDDRRHFAFAAPRDLRRAG